MDGAVRGSMHQMQEVIQAASGRLSDASLVEEEKFWENVSESSPLVTEHQGMSPDEVAVVTAVVQLGEQGPQGSAAETAGSVGEQLLTVAEELQAPL